MQLTALPLCVYESHLVYASSDKDVPGKPFSSFFSDAAATLNFHQVQQNWYENVSLM